MICKRCQGVMSKESIFTLYGEISMFHCLNCGEWMDDVVVSNRSRHQVFIKNVQDRKDRLNAASLWWKFVRNKKCVVS